MDKLAYKSAATKCFYGVIAFAVLGIVGSAITAFCLDAIAMSMLSGSLPWYLIVIPVLTAACYIYFIIGLSALAKAVDANDTAAVKKLRVAAILTFITTLCGFLPYLILMSGSLAGSGFMTVALAIVGIIAIIFNFIGYVKLKKSETFPGRKGANLIFIAMIISLVASVFAIIPVVKMIASIASMAVLIMMIIGWLQIKNAEVAE